MSIQTLDDLIAGFANQPPRFFLKAPMVSLVAGRPYSTWPLAGIPGAGSQDVVGLNGSTLDSTGGYIAGMLPFSNPAGGKKSYLGRMSVGAGVSGHALLCDRLWSNSAINITSTSSQAITSPTWPSRDNNGATLGDGVFLGVEVSAATGAGTPSITVGYTNSAGTASRSGTNTVATAASAPAGTFFPIGLQANDLGVRSVQSIQLSSSWSSGTINLVAYRIIAAAEMQTAWCPSLDVASLGLPQMFDGTVPFLIGVPSSTAVGPMIGSATWAQN